MQRLRQLGMIIGLTAASSFGASWTGKLIDASCADRNPQGATPSAQAPQTTQSPTSCSAGANTSAFALQTSDGQILKFDASGNTKATETIRKDPNKANMVTVTGSMDGRTLKVDSIDASPSNNSAPSNTVPSNQQPNPQR